MYTRTRGPPGNLCSTRSQTPPPLKTARLSTASASAFMHSCLHRSPPATKLLTATQRACHHACPCYSRLHSLLHGTALAVLPIYIGLHSWLRGTALAVLPCPSRLHSWLAGPASSSSSVIKGSTGSPNSMKLTSMVRLHALPSSWQSCRSYHSLCMEQVPSNSVSMGTNR